MDSFFTELQTARERKGISLAEISDVTLINIKMLEALERGDVNIVPQAYIRAFLREYASIVGLDKDVTMKNYDAWRKSKEATSTSPATAGPVRNRPRQQQQTSRIQNASTQSSTRATFERLVPSIFKIAAAIIVLVLADIALWSFLEKEPTKPVRETPFRDIVKENEDRAGNPDTTEALARDSSLQPPTQDSSHTKQRVTTAAAPMVALDKDSLTLVATTTDNVWMQIVVDDNILTEHSLLPNTTFRWKAKSEFWISAIGNPSAITLTLNNKPVTIPVKPGFVTRDLQLNRETLKSN